MSNCFKKRFSGLKIFLVREVEARFARCSGVHEFKGSEVERFRRSEVGRLGGDINKNFV
jgi:hypothetical protein